jgi:hypothetical protein
VKGQWKQLTDEAVALIEAQLKRLERLEHRQDRRVTDPRHRRSA